MCNYHLLTRYISSKKCNCILTEREALLKKKIARDSLCCLNGSFTSGTTDFVKSINSLSDNKNQWRNSNFRKKQFGKNLWMPIGIIVKSITNTCLLNALYTYKQNMQCTHVCMCVPYMVPYVRTLVPLGIFLCQIRVRGSSLKIQNLLTLVVNGLDRLAVWHTGSNPPLSLCGWGYADYTLPK
jgi:hypothetical protein